MNFKVTSLGACVLALWAFSYVQSAGAAPLLCQDPTVNHMYVDDSQVSACLGAGVGNINGNPANDAFLTGEGAGSGLINIGESDDFTQNNDFSSGTWSIDSSLWQTWTEIAIGFKFGTGNQADEWFVYLLSPLVSSGAWQFVDADNKRGDGLSHLQIYGRQPVNNVPEPGTLALLGVGLLGAAVARRRKQA